MRSPFLSTLVLVACSVFTAAAHADTFKVNNLQYHFQGVDGSSNVVRQTVVENTTSSVTTLDNAETADLAVQSGTPQLTSDNGGKAVLVITDLTTRGNTAAHPGSSSLMLLGTGLMGVAGITRRRVSAA